MLPYYWIIAIFLFGMVIILSNTGTDEYIPFLIIYTFLDLFIVLLIWVVMMCVQERELKHR